MDKQRYSKPYMGRFWLYRAIVGGVWRKYGYRICSDQIEGWYWTQKDYDYACGGQLINLKTVTYR